MNGDNRSYWKAREGQRYAEQQEVRRLSGQDSYARQEAWLEERIGEMLEQRGAIRLLDFGVGFGRMARLFADREGVTYFGYDISDAMVAPLLADPPAAMADTDRRILVGERLDDVAGDLRFDVVFTVSVLIHNSPAQVLELLSSMRRVLAPGGEIWLIENRPSAISMQDNVWHNGCWVHDFAYGPAADLDVDIDLVSVPEHGIYRLREPSQGRERQLRATMAGPGMVGISRAEFLEMALPRTEQAIRGLESELAGIGPDVGAARDNAELYRRAEVLATAVLERVGPLPSEHIPADSTALNRLLAAVEPLAIALRQTKIEVEARDSRIVGMADEAAAQQARIAELESINLRMADAFDRRRKILRAIVEPRHTQMESSVVAHPEGTRLPANDDMQFDALRDTRFAHSAAGFERVCHLMHQEWFGIRAAAGALPGHKMAITSHRPPTGGEIDRALTWMSERGIERIAVHGFSDAMEATVKALSAAGMEHISLVWHGAPVMWVHEAERRLFFLAVSLAEKGFLKRIHVMRAGTDVVVGPRGWAPQLLNIPPRVPERPRRPEGSPVTAFAPSWNLIHKNLSTNVLGAIEVEQVEKVWVLAKDFALPRKLHGKIEVLPKLDQPQIIEAMRLSNLVLNASIVDCHPMVELEALAVGTPSIRGRLWLDVLEDHPYVRLTEVSDPLSVRAVSERVAATLSVRRDELEGMMSDYARQLVSTSFDRYREFLEL